MSSRAGTNFFERQDSARRRTKWLYVLLVVAVAALSVGTFVIVGGGWWLTVVLVEEIGLRAAYGEVPWVEVAVGSVIATAGFIIAASVYKHRQLGEGGAAIMNEFGATEVDASSDDSQRLVLVNVVEEMAIAAGIPVPRTYLLEGQTGINAFAAGYTANDAAIAVTRGAVEQLSRDELQAMVAHEFSHILNGDMRLNVRLIGIVYGMMVPYLAGMTILDSDAEQSWAGKTYLETSPTSWFRRVGCGTTALAMGCVMIPFVMIPAAVLALFGRIGAAFAEGIKSAISRQREYLADAAAVQFTRNPEAMVSVLEKIRSHGAGSRLLGARARLISHMCFGNVAGRYRRGGGALSTHPPMAKRIEALGALPKPGRHHRIVLREDIDIDAPRPDADEIEEIARRHPDAGDTIDPGDVVEHIAEPRLESLVYCSSLLDEIPDALRTVRSELLETIAIATLLVLDPDPEVRSRQADVVQQSGSNALRRECRRLWPQVKRLERRLELPLMDLVYPTLRKMTDDQYATFSSLLDEMVHVSGEVAFRDFIIEWILLHRLEMALFDANRDVVQYRSFRGLIDEVQLVVSCVAEAGGASPQQVVEAFEQAREELPTMIRDDAQFQAPSSWSFDDVGEALEKLSVATPNIKQVVVRSCAACVVSDATLSASELEILRAIAEALDVPLGPMGRGEEPGVDCRDGTV